MPTHMLQMTEMRAESTYKGGIDLIMDVELLACLFDNGSDFGIVAVTYAWKQMVHYLIIQSARKMRPKPGSMAIISATQRLRLSPASCDLAVSHVEPINIACHMRDLKHDSEQYS